MSLLGLGQAEDLYVLHDRRLTSGEDQEFIHLGPRAPKAGEEPGFMGHRTEAERDTPTEQANDSYEALPTDRGASQDHCRIRAEEVENHVGGPRVVDGTAR